jgi:hypothetical protein
MKEDGREGGAKRARGAAEDEEEEASAALPSVVPSYVLRYTSSSVQEAWAKAVTTMHSSSHAMLRAEWKRAEEAALRCEELEKVVLDSGRMKVQLVISFHAYSYYYDGCKKNDSLG